MKVFPFHRKLIMQVIEKQVRNYATAEKPSAKEIEERVLKVVAAYDKISADQVDIINNLRKSFYLFYRA